MCGRIDRSYRISGRGVDLWRGPASCPSRGGPLKKEDKQKGDEGKFPQVKVPLSFFEELAVADGGGASPRPGKPRGKSS